MKQCGCTYQPESSEFRSFSSSTAASSAAAARQRCDHSPDQQRFINTSDTTTLKIVESTPRSTPTAQVVPSLQITCSDTCAHTPSVRKRSHRQKIRHRINVSFPSQLSFQRFTGACQVHTAGQQLGVLCVSDTAPHQPQEHPAGVCVC
jgi:hypothetical protein